MISTVDDVEKSTVCALTGLESMTTETAYDSLNNLFTQLLKQI